MAAAAAATRRAASSLVSRCLLSRPAASPAVPSALRRADGTCGLLPGILQRFSTAAAAEEPISPPVQVNYTQLLINGNFVDSASGKTFPTLDARTGEVIANVAEGDAEDIDRAVVAARKAFDEGPWPKMTAYERSRILLRFADLIEKHNDDLAALETWDNGKPYEQAAHIEVPMVARLMRYYAGWADKIHGLVVPADGPHHVQVLHEPIGVAGQIIPWNFPLLMFAWKVGPALACGNTVVLKTAEQTPLSALYISKLLHEAGLPEGVLNVISGFGPTAGAALASHMDVDKIAFTGSTDTGKIVLELAARSNLKPVTLELGGIHGASKERAVGRRVALEREKAMKWLDNERYLAVVNHLAGAGNPEACFIVSLTLVFADQDVQRGLVCLDRAAVAGHKTAAYVLGLGGRIVPRFQELSPEKLGKGSKS